MNWHENLYVGEEAGKNRKKIIQKLEQKKLSFGVYVITLAANEKDLLDLLPAHMLYREEVRQRQIVGLALTKEEALEVCEQILLDVHQKTGGYDVRSFFS